VSGRDTLGALVGNFWSLWVATALANLADGVFKLALPLFALTLTDSPVLIAGVVFVLRLPWLLFSLPVGVLVDYYDRRQMMIAANFSRVIILSTLVIAMSLNMLNLLLIYLSALALGIAETIADTAASAILPSVVETQELERANARLVGVITVTNEFIGPPLGGAIAAIALVLSFATSSALYLVAALALLLMMGSFRPLHSQQHTRKILPDIMIGLRYVWNNPLLRVLTLIVTVMNIGWSAWVSVMVLYVITPGPGGLSEFGYGILLTSIGIGGVLGTIFAVPFLRRFGRSSAVAMDILGTFIMLLIPALTANAWAIGVAAVMGGIGSAMWGIVVSSIRQQIVPDEMLGRTSGVFRLFGYGALSVGAALAGIVAQIAGIPAVFALCALMTAFLIIPFTQVKIPERAS
jgi:MFS family permease